MESNKLVSFIGRLATDPGAQEAFAKDAAGQMRQAGLTDGDARELARFCKVVCGHAPTYLGGGDSSDGGD